MFLLPLPRSSAARRCGNEFDHLFGRVFGSSPLVERWLSPSALPALSVWEDEGHLFVEVDVPGFKEDDLDISVADGELTIKGKREDVEQEGAAYLHRERRQSSFSRSLALAVDIDADRVEASLNHGVLLLKLPKSEAVKPRRIAINTKDQ